MAGTHEADAIGTRMCTNIFRQFSTCHPNRKDLEGIDGGAYKRDDVWVFQVLPQHDLLTERLRISSETQEGGGGRFNNVRAWQFLLCRSSKPVSV